MGFKRLIKLGLGASRTFRVPQGQRVYAVGDIHGRLDMLRMLVDSIEADDSRRDVAETVMIFLGDLVDRGPDSRGVIDYLIELQERRACRFLLGNHDEIFLKAATGDPKAMRFLTRIGGKEALLSYGLSEADYLSTDFPELLQEMQRIVPAEHVNFLSSFEDLVVIGDYAFVHAGIRPGVDFDRQEVSDLRWIRREFLECRTMHEKMVVHGHSISPEAVVRSNRIGIDTGAFASGILTALGLESTDRWFVTASGAPDPRWQLQSHDL